MHVCCGTFLSLDCLGNANQLQRQWLALLTASQCGTAHAYIIIYLFFSLKGTCTCTCIYFVENLYSLKRSMILTDSLYSRLVVPDANSLTPELTAHSICERRGRDSH